MAKTQPATDAFNAGKGALDAAVKASRYLSRGRYDRALQSLTQLLGMTPDVVVVPPPPPPPPPPDPDPPPGPDPVPVPVGLLRAVLSDGTILTEAAPRKGPWFAQFREANGRTEIIVNLGLCHSGAASNANVTWWKAYSGETLLGTRTMPRFHWRGRDRWESKPHPFIRTVAQAVADGFFPAYSKAGLNKLNTPGLATYSPMGSGPVQKDMGGTGGRPDIGIHTGWAAAYFLDQSAANEASLRAVAEVAGSLPCQLFDENTGKPVSPAQYPMLTNDDPRWPGSPKLAYADTGWNLDGAHWPDVSYPMAVLTGDPYHIENLQMQVITLFAGMDTFYRKGGKYEVFILQVRDWAWKMRLLARAAMVTPVNGGPHLLPRKVFLDLLENNRFAIIRDYVSNPKPQQSVFHDIMDVPGQPDEGGLGGRYIKPWQGTFCTQVLEDMLRMGFVDWTSVADWFLDPMLKRTTAGSGWNRAYPCNYQDVIANTSKVVVGSYAEAWALTKTAFNYSVTGDALAPTQDWNYMANMRACLAMAAKRNAQAKANFDWLHPQLANSPWGVDLQLAVTA